ncbi:DNA repair protein RecO [Galbibacter mesophilus]|uniref:DNA repair protein RecO n=1 Tax=Galbibacter mesophilus TaxID=379069 RepID=UPI00191F4625|nr:DNA repair protein RecO [Galbibacter mesophilus]MCM5662451.1 DNA repair protein RecO [Galbibacter mesophilus]
MIVTTKAIVLSALRYGDTSLIVRLFSESDGVKSYMLKGVLASKKGKIKKGYFQPLTQLEVVANHKNKGTLESLRDVKLTTSYETLQTDVLKSSMALFLSEMLVVSLQEEEENKPLFNFLSYSFDWLDRSEEIANFHISFLVQLTQYLGFYPDDSNINLPYFDLTEGEFVPTLYNEVMEGAPLLAFKQLLNADFDASKEVKMNRQTRAALLNHLIRFYQLHLNDFKKPRSLEILQQVFG